ncbi:MAG: hypothetical protein ABIW84_11140, partial [Ilumatobacteraceae bacterium]
MRARSLVTAALIGAAAVVGCGGCSSDRDGGATPITVSAAPSVPAATSGAAPSEAQQFPEIIEATATGNGGTWTFEVTVSSPYDTPERYADGWRVLGPDGTVYGEHEL